MTHEVRLSPDAQGDLLRLAEFLVDHNPNTAERAMKAISAGLRTLAEHPNRGRSAQRPELKELVVPFGRQGYIVQYRVDPDVVVISRIFHALETR